MDVALLAVSAWGDVAFDAVGDGFFKGFLSQGRYDFPLWRADRAKDERFEVVGHVLAEFFNPGDDFETSRPACFVRRQVELRF